MARSHTYNVKKLTIYSQTPRPNFGRLLEFDKRENPKIGSPAKFAVCGRIFHREAVAMA